MFYRLEMAQVSETPVLVDSESEDEEELVMDKEDEEDDGASVYSDDSDDCSEEGQEPVEMIKTKLICDKESGKGELQEMTLEAVDTPAEPKEPKELEWRLAYAGSETSTEVRHLAPATQYQVRPVRMKLVSIFHIGFWGLRTWLGTRLGLCI